MDVLHKAIGTPEMDPIDTLRLFFLLSAATAFSISIPSSLRTRFLVYGPRTTSTPAATAERPEINRSTFLDYLATWQVPHRYFTHFYIASVLSSVFWFFQLACRGTAFQLVAARMSEEHLQQSMSLTQVLICWILLAIQGGRRLWESYKFAKPSSSQMSVAHWFLGITFYMAAGMAIWVEGCGAIRSYNLTLDDIKMTNAPTARTFFCVPLFLMMSGLQHDCHHFLFSLKKYTVPDHPIFRTVVCPHYGAECLIYLSLALLAAPPGHLVNKTMLTCLGFVAVNLALTARTTKDWYKEKFGLASVQDRWLMIPWVY